MQGFGAMEVGFYSSELGKMIACFAAETMMVNPLFLAGKYIASLFLMTRAFLGDVSELSGLTSIGNRFPIDELRKRDRCGPENMDGSDTEDDDDEDEDGVDGQDDDDDDDEDFQGEGKDDDDDDDGDPEDDGSANGNGGSDEDGDDDDDGDEDDDEDDNEDEDEDEEEEEEDDQPPAKKRK